MSAVTSRIGPQSFPARPRDFSGPGPLPEPTAAPPGSGRKVRVLAARARLGLALFHPGDAAAGDRLAYAPGKGGGPNGAVFRLRQLLELSAGAADAE